MAGGSTSRRRGFRSSKSSYPGCMGRLMNFLDFTQATPGRHLLTHKDAGSELEALNSSSEADSNTGEMTKAIAKKTNTKTSDDTYINLFHKPKKASKLPIKTLIAEELSNSSNPNRGSNVVARLMGLEVPPSGSQECTGEKKNMDQKSECKSGRVSFEGSLSTRLPVECSDGSAAFRKSDPNDPNATHRRKSNFQECDFNEYESTGTQSHDYSSDFKRWQSSDIFPDTGDAYGYTSSLEKTSVGQSQNSSIVQANGKLYESKEIVDALEFLRCNKDLVMKFLPESNTLLDRHFQNGDILEDNSEFRVMSLESNEETLSLRESFNNSEQECYKECHQSSPVKPFKAVQQHRNPLYCTDSEIGSGHPHPAPTRIVVLKPRLKTVRQTESEYRERNSSIKSSKGHSVSKGNVDALLGDCTNIHGYKHSYQGRFFNEQYPDVSLNPKEIAQEIARQVRENVSRNFMIDHSRFRSIKANSGDTRTEAISRDTGNSSYRKDAQSINHGSENIYHREKNINTDLDYGIDKKQRLSDHLKLKPVRRDPESRCSQMVRNDLNSPNQNEHILETSCNSYSEEDENQPAHPIVLLRSRSVNMSEEDSFIQESSLEDSSLTISLVEKDRQTQNGGIVLLKPSNSTAIELSIHEESVLDLDGPSEHDTNSSISMEQEVQQRHEDCSCTPMREDSNSLNGSTTMDTEKVYTEQPSPISVLELCYHDTESKENFDCQGVRAQLQLRFNERVDTDQEMSTSGEINVTGDTQTMENLDLSVNDEEYFGRVRAKLGFQSPEVLEDQQMLYVKDLLLKSGVIKGSYTLSSWPSSAVLIDSNLFQTLEKDYEQASDKLSDEQGIAPSKYNNQQGKSCRQLLFDAVNEILSKVLKPRCNYLLWLRSPLLHLSMPRGNDLARQVYSEISSMLSCQSKPQETLESLICKDLTQGSQWPDMNIGVEVIGLYIEKAILDDLIEEILLVL